MPQAGEFYVNIGVKGSEKTLGTLTDVKHGMGDVKAMSLEAKAAILGAVYGLEQLMSQSLKLGTTLTNAGTVMGIQTDQLYKYDKAIEIVSGHAGEGLGAIQKLFSLGAENIAHGTLPEGWAQVNKILAQSGQQLNREDLVNPLEALRKLQIAALSPTANAADKALLDKALSSFVGNEDVVAALERGAITPGALSRVRPPSAKEIAGVDSAAQEFRRLFADLQKALFDVTYKFGVPIAKDLEQLLPPLKKLTEALLVLIDELRLIPLLGSAAQEGGEALGAVSSLAEAVTGSGKGGRSKALEKVGEYLSTHTLAGVLLKSVQPLLSPLGNRLSPHQTINNYDIDQHNEINGGLNSNDRDILGDMLKNVQNSSPANSQAN